MSFLEKEESNPSNFWDWVVGIGLVLAVGGFTVFYQYQVRSSHRRFQEADALFQARNFKAAESMYEDLKSAQYLTTANDSTIYARLDTVETAREQQVSLVAQARTQAAAGELPAVRQTLAGIDHPELLPDEDKAWMDSIKSASATAAKP